MDRLATTVPAVRQLAFIRSEPRGPNARIHVRRTKPLSQYVCRSYVPHAAHQIRRKGAHGPQNSTALAHMYRVLDSPGEHAAQTSETRAESLQSLAWTCPPWTAQRLHAVCASATHDQSFFFRSNGSSDGVTVTMPTKDHRLATEPLNN